MVYRTCLLRVVVHTPPILSLPECHLLVSGLHSICLGAMYVVARSRYNDALSARYLK